MRLLLPSAVIVAALVAGIPALAQNVQVYNVPAGSRPHDVAPAPDGLVWYTGQVRGVLGILDPVTGDIREIPLGPGSRPHGVIQGPDGAARITDGGQNAIVRFNPANEEITVWPLPAGAGNANLNTAAFDGDGVLWFTGQSGVHGRLDPVTGAMDVYPAPRGRGPYGIAATPDGEIYYASLAGNHIARIDRATGEAIVIEPPTRGQGARRVWSDSQGRIWVSEWNSGLLSLYDPADNSWRSWQTPGADPAIYAVYVDERDIVWVSDFGASAIYSFDLATEEFTTYPNSGRGGNVRQILGRPGEIWLPESGLNRLMVIRY